MPQVVDVVGVLHEPHVEDEISLQRHAMLEAKADQLKDELLVCRCVFQVGKDALLELSKRQRGGIDDQVRVGSNWVEEAALLCDGSGDATAAGQWVAVAGLRKASDEDVISGFEEDYPGVYAPAFKGTAHRCQRKRRIAGPHIQNDRDLLETLPIARNQFRQIRQQLPRQVIHTRVPE